MKKILILFCLIICYSGLSAEETEQIVILGGGPAGLTCSLFAAQAHLNPLVIEGNQVDGQVAYIQMIENFPGFPEGISGIELSKRIKIQAEKFGAQFCPNSVVGVDLTQNPFVLTFQDGETLLCKCLVIATGASPRWLGLESEKALIGHGISANAIIDGPQYAGQRVCVVGGGDSAMEQALLLAEYAKEVTIFYRGDKLPSAQYLQDRIHTNPAIKVCLNTTIVDILTDQGHATGVVVKNGQGQETVPLEGIFVANGRKPNTDIFKGQLEMDERGYIITSEPTSKTSVEGVFAAGDITTTAYRKTITAAASGCISAIDATKYLAEKEKE